LYKTLEGRIEEEEEEEEDEGEEEEDVSSYWTTLMTGADTEIETGSLKSYSVQNSL